MKCQKIVKSKDVFTLIPQFRPKENWAPPFFELIWSARNYSFFWGRSLDEGIKYRLGTLFPEQSVQNMNEIVIKPRELPPHFDAREK
ncbi:hypothetical protein ANCDUO_11404 [Ancylostoma duodenale]|uniref:Uncharacterized protein n=1 Tax=Ancylostoma duodenale TaxID=51022 RepID=A0A0C2GHS7_9BILA|nr:hypothetical protein ANCDUO_11404 [Ancylostoma duodenale]